MRRIRARLAHAMGGGASRCARRFDVCAHVRGVNTEIGAADAAGTATRKTCTLTLSLTLTLTLTLTLNRTLSLTLTL